MDITINKPDGTDEYQITIKCKKIPPELISLLNSFQTGQVDKHLIGYIESKMHRINPKDIFYVESVDKKIFLYDEHAVYGSRQKLYELEEELSSYDFLRVSKTTIINLSKIKTITPILSGKLEATLLNDEKIIISRQYSSVLKGYLGL